MMNKSYISFLLVIASSNTQSSYWPEWNISYKSLPELPSLPDLSSFPAFPSWPALPDFPSFPLMPELPQQPFQNFSFSGSFPELPQFTWFQTNISETSTVGPKGEEESWLDSNWFLRSLTSPDAGYWFQEDDNVEKISTDKTLMDVKDEATNETDWFQSYRDAVRLPSDWIRRYENAVETSALWIESYTRTVEGTDSWLDKYGNALGITDGWIDKYMYAKAITDASIEHYENAVNVTEEWYENYKTAMVILNDTYRTVDWFLTYKDKLAKLNYTLLDEGWLETYTDALALLQDGIPTAEVFAKYTEAVNILNEAFGEECTNTTITCPNTNEKTGVEVCCSSLWLSLGAPIGLGTECWINLEEIEEGCTMYSCYRNKKEGNVTNLWNADGCSWVPDILLNYESCVLHDLCYVTPGMTKVDCDVAMMDNINKIYCDNVNDLEREACQARASWANAILGYTDKYFLDCAWEREACKRTNTGIQHWDSSKDMAGEEFPPLSFDDQLKPYEKCLMEVEERDIFTSVKGSENMSDIFTPVEKKKDILERFTEASFCVLEQAKNRALFSRKSHRIKTRRRLKKIETTLLLKAHCDNANNNNSSMKKPCRDCFRAAFRRQSNINDDVTACSKNFLNEKYEKCTSLLENKKKGEGKLTKRCFDTVLLRGILESCLQGVTTADMESFRGVLDCIKEKVNDWINNNTSPRLARRFKSYFNNL